MANASSFTVAGNDEHGIDPPTFGKRTPTMPYLNRPFYENEFSYPTKNYFLATCSRLGYSVYDVKPERQDVSISTRVTRVNSNDISLVVTFAYNATVNENFNSWGGLEVFYSTTNRYATFSRLMSEAIYSRVSTNGYIKGNSVMVLNGIGMLSSVDIPASLIEGGFMTNFDQAKLMVDPDYQNLIATLTAEGICNYLGVNYFSPLATTYPLLRLGSRGNFVKCLQNLLINQGYSLSADGVFGSITNSAVQSFQNTNLLAVDGVVGANTWSKVNNLSPQNSVLRVGSRGVEVLYMQRKLLSKLYPVGTLDGIFGNNTFTQVRAFQSENGLVVDGIVGANTWNKLRVIGGGRPLI